ncbi:MAG: ImmA/IrrE family metallo-endopeptidase [Microbacteriaceae bacterium]
MTLPRGFKAKAERDAAQLRSTLGLGPASNLDVVALAEHLDVRVVDAAELIERERLEELERLQAFAFSAATFRVAGRSVIVTNPLRTPARRASDIAHELAHVLLEHDLSEVRKLDGITFRTCEPGEEEQATAFGGTLMLPRPLLLAAAKRGLGPDAIAETYGVTPEMARYRYNTTGVAKQVHPRG